MLGDRRSDDPLKLVVDGTLVRSELGWSPERDLGEFVNNEFRWESVPGRRLG